MINAANIQVISMLGVQIHSLSVKTLMSFINQTIQSDQKALISNVNINAMNLAYEYEWFREFLNLSEIVFCDGYGVVLGARLLGYKVIERITYADWMWHLAEFAEVNGYSLFFLGARPGIAEKAARLICQKYPKLSIVGVQHGYFDKTHGSKDNLEIIKRINSVKPNILTLGLGMPLQERWLMENWNQINSNIALTGGAVFDYVSGELHRPPSWMTDHGFEWLGRMIIEPSRLWRRYIIGNPVFLWRVLMEKFRMSKN